LFGIIIWQIIIPDKHPLKHQVISKGYIVRMVTFSVEDYRYDDGGLLFTNRVEIDRILDGGVFCRCDERWFIYRRSSLFYIRGVKERHNYKVVASPIRIWCMSLRLLVRVPPTDRAQFTDS
jgi:hypothetical protein